MALNDVIREQIQGDFDYEDFYKIFYLDSKEKKKEHTNMLSAFEALKKNQEDDFILIDDFYEAIKTHENKYLKAFDQVRSEIEDTDFYDPETKRFYFVDYLQKLYCVPDNKSWLKNDI